jgi:ATP-dependent Lon protease
MPEAIRKTLQEEINGLDAHKSDSDGARKVAYLTQVFRLPWDQRTEAFWDVAHSR